MLLAGVGLHFMLLLLIIYKFKEGRLLAAAAYGLMRLLLLWLLHDKV